MTNPTPDKFDLYQTHRYVQLGQWLDSNDNILDALHTLISNTVVAWSEDPDDDCHYMCDVSDATYALSQVLSQLRQFKRQITGYKEFEESGCQLILTRPMACPDHRHTLIACLPKEEAANISAAA